MLASTVSLDFYWASSLFFYKDIYILIQGQLPLLIIILGHFFPLYTNPLGQLTLGESLPPDKSAPENVTVDNYSLDSISM